MKKITLLVALFFISLQINAQNVFEGFETPLTWTILHPAGSSTNAGWSKVTTGVNPACDPYEGNGMVRFNSYDIAAGNSYSLNSTPITFEGPQCRVKFRMYRDNGYPTENDRVRIYYNTSPTHVGGTLLGTVNRSMSLTPIVETEGWYSYAFNIPATALGTGYISILGTSSYGTNMFLDNVAIIPILTNDAELNTVNLTPIIAANPATPIAGNFKNISTNAINSIDVNWQVDGGAVHTQSLTGLDIAPNATYAYSHSDTWNVGPGNYALDVWLSNVNGGADNDDTNNHLTKTIQVASNSTTRLPLFEKFSSSTCAPCAAFNGGVFNGFFADQGENFALINYQVNWPGAGDPYYTAEVGTRVAYYGVNAAPTLFIDAKDESTGTNATILTNRVNQEIAKPAYFALNATHNIVGNDITVTVDVIPYLTGAYTLHAVVVEKVTTGNIATNGETEFHDIMMKMLPNANGTALSCVLDVPMTETLNATLTGLNIEEMEDLEVVVFVQNNTDKSIMNARISTASLGTNPVEGVSKIKLYPNPSNGIVRINTENAVDVTVADITGKVVFSMKQVTSETAMDLSSLQKGVYVAKILDGGMLQTQKIILK